MRILITGGRGYIARHLHERLREAHEVVAQGRRELDLLDAGKVEAVLRAGCYDAVLHTATHDPAPRHSTKDPAKVLENNLRMFFNVARCSDHFGRMIFFGSGAEFGREHWRGSMGEDYFDVHVPVDQYGFSKYMMTRYALQHRKIFNLRVFSVFGSHEDWRYRFISRACCRAMFDLPIVVTQNARYDQLPIGDLVRITEWLLGASPRHQVYNVCRGQTYEFRDLAERVARISGRSVPVRVENAAIAREYGGDNTRLLAELGGFRFTPLDEAIAGLYAWYEQNKSEIQREEL